MNDEVELPPKLEVVFRAVAAKPEGIHIDELFRVIYDRDPPPRREAAPLVYPYITRINKRLAAKAIQIVRGDTDYTYRLEDMA